MLQGRAACGQCLETEGSNRMAPFYLKENDVSSYREPSIGTDVFPCPTCGLEG